MGNEGGMNNEEVRGKREETGMGILFFIFIHQFASRDSFTVCEFGSFFGMPASLKH